MAEPDPEPSTRHVKKFADYSPSDPNLPSLTAADGLHVRPAEERDVPHIARLKVAREGGDVEATSPSVLNEIARAAETGRGVLWVAALGDELVGYARAGWFTPGVGAPANSAPEGWYLQGVIVDPRWRRRGIGTALTRARLEWIAQRGDTAWFFATALNRASIELHERLGFEERTRDFHAPGTSFTGGIGILFAKRLR
jgi:ribosomal protein S18 acetylase RimI-like enzyme